MKFRPNNLQSASKNGQKNMSLRIAKKKKNRERERKKDKKKKQVNKTAPHFFRA